MFDGSSGESSECLLSSERDCPPGSSSDRPTSTQLDAGGNTFCAVLVFDDSNRGDNGAVAVPSHVGVRKGRGRALSSSTHEHLTAAQEADNHKRAVAWSNEGFAYPCRVAGTGPTPCSVCHGYHSDLKVCPTHLARQDDTYKRTPGSSCHWRSGGVTCGSTNHFSRHHRAQWVAEHPGASFPAKPKGAKGKGAEGKGAKGKGAKGRDAKGEGKRFV